MGRLVLTASIVAFAWWMDAGSARACETLCVTAPIPAEGSTLPRNAAVRFENVALDAPLAATLDGAATDLVTLPLLSAASSPFSLCPPANAARVTPMPAVGQQLVVKDVWAEQKFAYTIVEADETPPAALTDISVDVHDYPGTDACSDCGSGYGINLWVSLFGGGQDGGSPIVHTVFFNDTGDGTDGAAVLTVLAGGNAHVVLPLDHGWTAAHDLLTDFCVTVRTFDLAHNEAVFARRVCKPCRARLDPGDDVCVFAGEIDEPAWTDADMVPDGQCTATQIPPLPPLSPEPDPEAETGSGTDTSGDAGTSAGSSSGAPASTGGASTTGGVPTTGGPTMGGPTTGEAGTSTTTSTDGGASATSSATGGGQDDPLVPHGCGCAGAGAPPGALLLLVACASRRRRGV